MRQGFIKLSQKQKNEYYGGFAWAPFIVAVMPFLINAVTQCVAAFKMLNSTKGSVKYHNYESHWDQKKQTTTTKIQAKSKLPNIQTLVYAY